MIRNLRAEIYTRSRFRNIFCKQATRENEKLHVKQRHKRVALSRKCIKEYFYNITDNNIVTNKIFSDFIRPFLVNKVSLNSCEIMIRKENEVVADTKEINEAILNDHYFNIAERSCHEKTSQWWQNKVT